MLSRIAILACVAGSALLGQKFEVVSIKPAGSCRPAGDSPSPDTLRIPCITLQNLISVAYGAFSGGGVRTAKLPVEGGPAWLSSDVFEIIAKSDKPVPMADMAGPMMRSLLEERFQVKVHHEQREKPAYALTVARGGARLKVAEEGSCTVIDLAHIPDRGSDIPNTHFCGMGRTSSANELTKIESWGATVAEFAGRMLQIYVDRPIVDQTGLTGKFDFHLEFPGGARTGAMLRNGVPVASAADSNPEGEPIFSALESSLALSYRPPKLPWKCSLSIR